MPVLYSVFLFIYLLFGYSASQLCPSEEEVLFIRIPISDKESLREYPVVLRSPEFREKNIPLKMMLQDLRSQIFRLKKNPSLLQNPDFRYPCGSRQRTWSSNLPSLGSKDLKDSCKRKSCEWSTTGVYKKWH